MAAALPIAYGISRMPRRWQPALLIAVMLPFWTAFLIRIYAWITILQREGLLNHLLIALNIIDEPIPILASNTAVYIGIVYSYLPFMVLPVYAVLSKMDDSLLDAAADLGCPRWKTFWLVTLPLARPGLFAGALICFIPIVGEFVIPDLLGDSRTADDRADAVDGILRQSRLADRVGARDRAAGRAADPDHDRAAHADVSRCGDDASRCLPLQCRGHRARPGISLSADRDPRHFLLQQFPLGRGLGRLLDALVSRIAQ